MKVEKRVFQLGAGERKFIAAESGLVVVGVRVKAKETPYTVSTVENGDLTSDKTGESGSFINLNHLETYCLVVSVEKESEVEVLTIK